MNPADIARATIDQLVTAYKNAAAAHGAAILQGDSDAANHHHDVIASIYRELRARGPQAQHALVPLMSDADTSVKGWAAAHGLEFLPEQAEGVLTTLARDKGVTAFSAEMTLSEWRKGRLSFP